MFKDTNVSDYLTLTDITKYLIALELSLNLEENQKIEDEQQQLFFTYLPVTGDYENDNVKVFTKNRWRFLKLSKEWFKIYVSYTRKEV